MKFKTIATRFAALGAVLFTTTCSFGQILGIETEADVAPADSQAPTGAFSINAVGAVTPFGNLTFLGAPDHFDGLASRADGTVWCFRIVGGGSQLCQVNTTTLICMPAPLFLAVRNIRGACFEAGGRLFAVDATLNQLLEVSPVTGGILATAPLKVGGVPYSLTTSCDISFASWGLCLTDANRFYRVGPLGGMVNINVDGVAGTDAAIPSNDGLALDGASFVTHDNNGRDDIYRYNPAGWARALLAPNVLPGVTSGRGDLAAISNIRLTRGGLVVVGGGGNPDGYNPWNWKLKDSQTGDTIWQGLFNVNGLGHFEVPMDFAGQFILEIDHPIACSSSRPITIDPDTGVAIGAPFALAVGDVDESGEIDAADIDFVIAHFSQLGGAADVDVSGEVDAADIDTVIGNFGEIDN